MKGRKEARISTRVLTIYEKGSTTSIYNFLKHQPDMVEKKYKYREEIDIQTAMQIFSATHLDLQFWGQQHDPKDVIVPVKTSKQNSCVWDRGAKRDADSIRLHHEENSFCVRVMLSAIIK